MPEPDIHKPWPQAWTWAIVLAVLLFGAHATMRWWGQALMQGLFGDIPTPADAPPLLWALLVCWVILSFIGGVLIAGCVTEGRLARDRARWAQERAACEHQWALSLSDGEM